jgi:hypothetical protein
MDKRGKTIASVIVVGIGISMVFVIGVPYVLSSSLYWEVEVDDVFSFLVTVSGFQSVVNSTGDTRVDPPLAGLNGQVVAARIVSLPNMTGYLNADEFYRNVILFRKIETSLQNGSSLSENDEAFLSHMISFCVLPVGSWSVIDYFFPDQPAAYDSHCIARHEGSHFHVGFQSWNFDAGGLLGGNCSLLTGMPFKIRDYRFNYGLPADYTIMLEGVEEEQV